MNERKYPIEQSDIDAAIERIKERRIQREKDQAAKKEFARHHNTFTHKMTPKQRKADREWLASRHKPVSLEEAIERLNRGKYAFGMSAKDWED